MADIRLIQVVHNMFRLGITRMVEATAKLEPAWPLRSSLGPYWAFYSSILDYHHHNEDDHDFPLLLSKYPDIQPLVDELRSGPPTDARCVEEDRHGDGFVSKAAPTWPARDVPSTLARSSCEISSFRHLDREDAEVLPMYARWIPFDEWDRLETKALKGIPEPHMAPPWAPSTK